MKKFILRSVSVMLALSVIMAVSSCSLPFKKDPMLELEYTEFPTEKYDADKVHPIRTSGTLSGAEAEAELSAVEWDYLKHYFEDDYIALRWCLSDHAAAGITEIKPSFGKVGPGDIRSECEFLTGLLERLYAIDFSKLEKQDRDFYDQIVFDIEEERYIKQYSGFYYMLPAIGVTSTGSFYLTAGYVDIRNTDEADMFLELLKDTGRYYDKVCEFEEERSAKGYASIDEFYSKCSNSYYMLTQESQTGPFRESFIEKIEAVPGITDEEKEAYIAEFDKVMDEIVIPEFLECCKRFAALEGTSVNAKGLAGFEHGAELYEHMLRRQIGRDCDVKALAEGLDKIISMEPASAAKPVIEGDSNREMMDNMAAKAEEYFPDLDINYEIVKLPKLFKLFGIGGTYAARYFDDPSKEIIFLLDSTNTKQIVFHEGIPGHMYQFNYHKTHLKHIYMLQFAGNAYTEGWATYIMNNPAALYGGSADAGFVYNGGIYRDYMVQARADICVNYEGLTLNETAEYISGLAPDISVVRSDIITMPGVGISYGLGCYMTLKTLESVRALDPEMDVKTMHTLYLDAGPGCFDRILTSVKREFE